MYKEASERVGWLQCDQIERFFKDPSDKISYKSCPNNWLLYLGYFEKCNYKSESVWLLFGQLLGEIGLLLIPASGHTGWLLPMRSASKCSEWENFKSNRIKALNGLVQPLVLISKNLPTNS